MGDLTLRPASAADAAAICEIYNQGIEDRGAFLSCSMKCGPSGARPRSVASGWPLAGPAIP